MDTNHHSLTLFMTSIAFLMFSQYIARVDSLPKAADPVTVLKWANGVDNPRNSELLDGTIMMTIRASGGYQYQSYSSDKGLTWSVAMPSQIKSPNSPASIERLSSTGDLILVWNNNGETGPGYYKAKRTPLSLAVSHDEGNSWNFIKDIEPNPDGFYCYTAIHEVQGFILLSYVRKLISDQGLGACIRRISLDEIQNKK